MILLSCKTQQEENLYIMKYLIIKELSDTAF